MALRLPSTGSMTTRQSPPAPSVRVADLLRDDREADVLDDGEVDQHLEGGVLGRLVDRDREIAARPATELVGPARPRHLGDGGADTVAHRAAHLEPALRRHGSKGSSWLKTMPSRIFGKKNVDLGGIVSSASATASTSATRRRRHQQGDRGARRLGVDERLRRRGVLAVRDASRSSRRRRRRARAGRAGRACPTATTSSAVGAAPRRRACSGGRPSPRTRPNVRTPRGGREDASLERRDVGDLLELPALAEQLGQALPQLGLEAADDPVRREQHEPGIVPVREVDGREVVGPQLGRVAVGRSPLVAVGEGGLVAVVAVDDRERAGCRRPRSRGAAARPRRSARAGARCPPRRSSRRSACARPRSARTSR